MKRLLAILLCFALALPTLALAEGDGYLLTVTQHYDGAQLAQLLSAAGAADASMIEPLVAALSALEVKVRWQPDGAQVALEMAGTELLSVTAGVQDGTVLVTSSLMPGMGVTVSQSNMAEAAAAAAQLDLSALQETLAAPLDQWLGTLHAVTETGWFVGECYAGGRERTVWTLDDRDLGVLLGQWLEALQGRDDVATLGQTLLGDDYAPFVKELERGCKALLRDNARRYRVAEVRGAQGETIGFTAEVSREGARELALSVGTDQSAATVLMTFAPCGEELYLAAAVDLSEESRMGWTLELWRSEGRDYSEVADGETGALIKASGELTTERSEDALHLRQTSDGYTAQGRERANVRTEETARVGDDGTGEYSESIWYGDTSGDALYTYEARVEKTVPFALPSTAALTVLEAAEDWSAEETALMNAALQTGMNDLGLKLFKALPTESVAMFLQLLMQ